MKLGAIRLSALSRSPVATIVAAGAIGIGIGLAAAVVLDPGHDWLASVADLSAVVDARALLAAGLTAAGLCLVAARLIASHRRKLAAILARDAELARLSWRLDFALSASEVGVWDVDLKTDELMWDDRARALFGVSEREGFYSEPIGLAWCIPDDRERALAAAHAAVAGDGRFESDYRIVLPDGQVRHVRDMAAVYRGEDGSHRLVGLVWDVSADVARQEELEIRRGEAEAATVAKSQFLAAMSHEIRTPMSGVLGMLGLMLDAPLPEKQRERATIARASAQSLLQILNDILDFSKLEAQQIRVREEAAMPRQIVREVLELMAAGAEQKRLRLTCDIAEAVPMWVAIDPMRLRQVLANLVSNALKFTEAGRVAVGVDYAATDTGGELVVRVEDTGIGISADCGGGCSRSSCRPTPRSAAAPGGTGLGLAISKQLVELMGGRIAVAERAGRGEHVQLQRPRPALRRAGGPRGGAGGAAPGAGPAAAARAPGRGQYDEPVPDPGLSRVRRATR